MAIWQYTFHILPKESTKQFNIKEGIENDLFWKITPIQKTLFNEVDLVLTLNKSWSDEIDLYGSVESNCLEVAFYKTDNTIISASLRIDFTSNYEAILNSLIQFFILKGLIIVNEEFNLTPLNYEVIKTTIETSPQFIKYNKLLSTQ